MQSRAAVPRGRYAPAPEVRQDRQRERLFEAASRVFARAGYADATAEAIAREAGMSKATFYEHFSNKEGCLLALSEVAGEVVLRAVSQGDRMDVADPVERIRVSVAAFVAVLDSHPEAAQTLLVEMSGAGRAAVCRRDAILERLARHIDELNRRDAAAGLMPRLASPDDAFAIVGAAVELASRHLRTGRPGDPRRLEAVLERVVLGVIGAGRPTAA